MAPSSTSALHPIVIDPVQVPPHFTTLGTGLLYDSHPRESSSTLRTLLLSKPPLITNQSKPKSWWRAQCLLYNLNAPGHRTVQDLRDTLEIALEARGGLVIPVELVELEHKENGKFRKLNAQVREATSWREKDGKGKGKSKQTKPAASKASSVAVNNKGSATIVSGKGKKVVVQKDPLKVVRGTTKIRKTQPASQSAATINLAITIPNGFSVMGPQRQPVKQAVPKTSRELTHGPVKSQAKQTHKPIPKSQMKQTQNLAPKAQTKYTPIKYVGASKVEAKAGSSKPKPKPGPKPGAGRAATKTGPGGPKPKAALVKQETRRPKTELGMSFNYSAW